MPLRVINLRVKRKGSGHTIKVEDDEIGTAPARIKWVRKQDADPNDPGDKFTFKSLTGLPTTFFSAPAVGKTTVTCKYKGCNEDSDWDYDVVVDDLNMEGKRRVPRIQSDGTATIKNH